MSQEKNGAENAPQSARFIETARAIGCEESESAFADRLKKLMAAPVKKEPTKAKKAKSSK